MEFLAEWGYIGLFLASFLAATIIPLSSEIVLSILIANNYDLSLSLVVASLGNWFGGLSSYAIGRLGNWSFIEKYFRIKKIKFYILKIELIDMVVFLHFCRGLLFLVILSLLHWDFLGLIFIWLVSTC